MRYNEFLHRHIGSGEADVQAMLHYLGLSSVDELVNQVVPASIRRKDDLNTGLPLTEYEYLLQIGAVARRNQLFTNFIGQGY